ncbi:MAG: T9SS type A sorting domain-containing protein [Bacteroidales bacterium]|nr:T9SS type A sorting domain-containing protein [Bacteroidales bacterium]
MKKIISIIVVLFFMVSLKASNLMDTVIHVDNILRDYEENYLLPANVDDYCMPLDFIDTLTIKGKLVFLKYRPNYEKESRYIFDWLQANYFPDNCNPDYINIMQDLAQPYFTDTLITIKGIAGFTHIEKHVGDTFYKDYSYEIWDSTLTHILASVNICDSLNSTGQSVVNRQIEGQPHYIEAFFEQPINMKGKFYTVFHTPDVRSAVADEVIGKYRNSSLIEDALEVYIAMAMACEVPEGMGIKARGLAIPDINYGDGNMMKWHDLEIGNPSRDFYGLLQWPENGDRKNLQMYLFPILGVAGTGIDVGIEGSLLDKSIYLYPNPVEEELSIGSSFQMKNISLYNISGQKLLENETSSHSETINLQNYPSGTYILKIQTEAGEVSKKFIKK